MISCATRSVGDFNARSTIGSDFFDIHDRAWCSVLEIDRTGHRLGGLGNFIIA